jgi:hypothetical protein
MEAHLIRAKAAILADMGVDTDDDAGATMARASGPPAATSRQ